MGLPELRLQARLRTRGVCFVLFILPARKKFSSFPPPRNEDTKKERPLTTCSPLKPPFSWRITQSPPIRTTSGSKETEGGGEAGGGGVQRRWWCVIRHPTTL